MPQIMDPEMGDVEDDASSPRRRSLLALAGSLLAELNPARLLAALVLMIVVPAVLLGLAPILVSIGYQVVKRHVATALVGIVPVLLLIVAAALALVGGRTLYRAVERSFWSLNSIAVQPGYVLFREGLRHLGERLLPADASAETRIRLRAALAAVAGVLLCGIALAVVGVAWAGTRWSGSMIDLTSPHRLIVPALANSVVVLGLYLAAAALVWGVADATMEQPRGLTGYDARPGEGRKWRVAHLSDLHAVGGRFDFRIESGRAGPRGNDRLTAVLDRLQALHAQNPLDLVLISGDMTDAGRSAEWAEFFAAFRKHGDLAERTLLLPGNHDLNIVDRVNPARLELPMSAGKRLRQMRTLSAMAAVQGDRVFVMDRKTNRLGSTLNDALAPHRDAIRHFAETGGLRFAARLARVWDDVFPMVLPPDATGGLGVVLLNSNAEANFSFTNALGLVTTIQTRDLNTAVQQFHEARWIIALHHHLVEYPMRVRAFSERIGTALINGSWFIRQLRPLGPRAVLMHGHRHIDWIGTCGGTRIISAPSPVMGPVELPPGGFYIHHLAAGAEGRLCLLQPQKIQMSD